MESCFDWNLLLANKRQRKEWNDVSKSIGKINAGIHPGGQGESYRIKSKNRSALISYVPALRFRRHTKLSLMGPERIELVPIAEESEGISLIKFRITLPLLCFSNFQSNKLLKLQQSIFTNLKSLKRL